MSFKFIFIGLMAAGASASASGEIAWLEKNYDFGLIKEAAGAATGSVRFVNMGKENVVVTGARPSCGCTGVFFSEDPVAPGDTATISFTYDPAGRPGKFDKSIRVYIGEHDSYRIGIKGNVLGTPESLEQFYPYTVGNLRISDTIVSTGEVIHGSARNFFVNAYNQSTDSITPVISSPDRALKVTCSEKKMGPGDIATFSIYFNAGAVKEVGQLEIPLTVTDGPGTDANNTEILFRANVTPDFSRLTPEQVDNGPRCYLIPEKTDLGIVSGGKMLEFSCGVQNQGKGKMNVLRISPKSEVIKVKKKPTVIKPGKKDDARFSFNPEFLPDGPFRIEADVITDDPLHPIRTLTVVGIKE